MAHDVKSLTLYPSPEMEDKANTMLAIHTNVLSALTNSWCNFAMCTEALKGFGKVVFYLIAAQTWMHCMYDPSIAFDYTYALVVAF